MNGFIGLTIAITGLLIFLLLVLIMGSNNNISHKLLMSLIILSLCISLFGAISMDVYTFNCCSTTNFSNTCKVCGYKLDLKDQWSCCGEKNYKNYCSVCGKEKNENTKIQDTENGKYIYCCETRYDPNINEFCSVCGKILEKTDDVLNE